MWKMLVDIANGEKTLPALRTFLASNLHNVEVSEVDKHCLFPSAGEEHLAREATTTAAASPLPRLEHPPYSSLQVDNQLTETSGKQSTPTGFCTLSEILSRATSSQNWPETTPRTGPELIAPIQVPHNGEAYYFPEQHLQEKLTEGPCF